jgi:hypothetical protein
MDSKEADSRTSGNKTPPLTNYDASKPVTAHEQALNAIRKKFPLAEEVQTIVGERMFTVDVDNSPALEKLINEAKDLRHLPFNEKLSRVQALTIKALPVNSVESACNGDKKARSLVYETHPLSDALEVSSGCCRYQGALFFILGREAELGNSHYMFTQRMGSRMFTVYNVVFDETGNRHLVSIYNQTLSPEAKQTLGYPEPTQTQPDDFAAGQQYYAYSTQKTDKQLLKRQSRLLPLNKTGANQFHYNSN